MGSYSVAFYGTMATDKARMSAYIQAMTNSITADSIVLDIGAGAGIMSLIACRLGARHVYAVEPDPVIILAEELAEANGFSARITFIRDLSTNIDLPEQADVIVSDLRGVLPLFGSHIASIADARTRHLAPGGVLIPQRDTITASVVEIPDQYSRYLEAWGTDVWGFDLSSQRSCVLNAMHNHTAEPESMLTSPLSVATLDYLNTRNPNIRNTLEWTATRNGTAHGISIWFDTELLPGVGFSTGPGSESWLYGMGLLLLQEPIDLEKDDVFKLQLRADFTGPDYIWQWHTCVYTNGDTSRVKAEFRQSNLDTIALKTFPLDKQASTFVPQPHEKVKIDQFILDRMNGSSTLEEISRQLADAYPKSFANWKNAFDHVSKLSLRYNP